MALSRDLSEAQIVFQPAEGNADDFLVVRYRGQEGLCQLYRFEIELVSSLDEDTFDQIVGQPASLGSYTEFGERWFHGIISRFEMTGESAGQSYYRAELVPTVWLLTHRYNSRIFQTKTIKDIIALILKEDGISEDRFDMTELTGDYQPLEYCVQYRETDYNFICRLMEEMGIRWYFEHTKEAHVFKMVDSGDAYPPIEGENPSLPFQPPAGMIATEEHIYRIRKSQCVRPGPVVLNDFNFKRPKLTLESTAGGSRDAALEFSDFPGEYVTQEAGTRIAELRAEEFESARIMGTGQSNSPRLAVGHKFGLTDHSSAGMNQDYLVTAITHQGKQAPTFSTTAQDVHVTGRDESAHRPRTEWLFHGGQVSRDASSVAAACGANPLDGASVPNLLDDPPTTSLVDGEAPPYNCRFEWIPASTVYRPPRITPWPVMRGAQTARIVGPEGEEIHTDEFGRVRVQFHWDREGCFKEDASCWIRVCHGFAGGQYGMMFLPRVGQEVVVDFLEGNPDKPMITGRVFNADHMPPYPLPAEKTKSTIKTRSSVGGEGFNEIRFEDLKGKEQIFIHGEKDLDVRIKNDQRNHVGNDKHEIIARDKKTLIERDEHRTVKQDSLLHVKRDQHVDVGGNSITYIGGDSSLQVEKHVEEAIGDSKVQMVPEYDLMVDNLVIDAANSITLKAGGNFVTIDSSGVTIVGSQVKINSGGSPAATGNSTNVMPDVAEEPDVADTGDPGDDTRYTRDTDERPWHDSTDEPAEGNWIGIRLWDDNGEPLPGERYEIVLPDGTTVARGTLDRKGEAYISGIDPGSCEVRFPALDAETWEAGPAVGGEGGDGAAGGAGSSTSAPPSAPGV